MIKFDTTYTNLPNTFFSLVNPTQVNNPSLIQINTALAEYLGIDLNNLTDTKIATYFSGNHIMDGSSPIAMAYAGHQFGHFVPSLGDGRAILLGEVTGCNGNRYDIQLKGAGRTPYSRRGDGRSSLGPVIREYLVSEAMHALGIKTTRSLAAVSTGESVYRESTLPGAILTRTAQSHVRIGTFEYFACREDFESVRKLADYCINRLYPEIKTSKSPYLDLLISVMNKQIKLISQWLSIGFIHGVMNTDNTSISGETIDYGPCAFMEAFNPKQVFSAIDQEGRYAYNNQASILLWNLMRLAETLLPLFDKEQESSIKKAQSVFDQYWDNFKAKWSSLMFKKIGITSPQAGDHQLLQEFLDHIEKHTADFTLSFRLLSHQLTTKPCAPKIKLPFFSSPDFKSWELKWKHRLSNKSNSLDTTAQMMDSVNPIIIPRNHLVEESIHTALQSGKYTFMKKLHECLKNPFEYQKGLAHFIYPATKENKVTQTFCGT